jgi:predicted nucleotide-binding protein
MMRSWEESKTMDKIFIGHGHSPVWLVLQNFLEKSLNLSVEEFNSVSVAGIPTATRLEQMLNTASFAFLVMTAEDETPDGKLRARLNVVHEAGLFRGKLGFKKAIILLEDGCEDFSNIDGLGHIQFPKDNIAAKFEEIRQVLAREEAISSVPTPILAIRAPQIELLFEKRALMKLQMCSMAAC